MENNFIALVFMGNDKDNFFIEHPPKRPPSTWIHKFVDNVDLVEFVEVIQRGKTVANWANPNSNTEK